MASLTNDQKDFLAHHNIPLSRLFDASGLARHEYSEIMRAEDKYFAYGVTECPKGHTLRSRPSYRRIGNCIQCGPATITFATRHYTPAYVYIAGSTASQLIKVGSSTEALNRLYIANLVGYADCSDWELLFLIHVQQAGRIENEVQSKLRPYQRQISFVRSGTRQVATECFACSYQQVYSKLATTLVGFGMLKGKQWRAERDILGKYEFDKLQGIEHSGSLT
jgi:T5orf172 domain